VMVRSTVGLSPNEVLLSDETGLQVEPMLWFGGMIDDVGAWSDAEIENSMRNLSFLAPRTILPPAGGLEP
jgi:hypothetical protein